MPADEESNKSARPEPVLIDTLGLAEGDRIEVAWQVEMTDGTEETMWWAATLSTVTDEEAVGDEYVLTYEAQHGFEVEQRRVVFSSDTALWDAVLRELLDWRREGEESDGEGEAAAEEGELQLDAAVKARFQARAFTLSQPSTTLPDSIPVHVLIHIHILSSGARGLSRGHRRRGQC